MDISTSFVMWFLLIVWAGIIGTMVGSFAVAQVWRLRARQLVEDKKSGESVPAGELKRLQSLTHTTITKDRSRCLSCSHQLAWHDLIPVVSWLGLGGRCRYCHQPIGKLELAAELVVGLLFALSVTLWPVSSVWSIIQLVLWLMGLVCLVILFIYDSKWFLLPDRVVWPFAALGLVSAVVGIVGSLDTPSQLMSLFGALLILPGLYLGLYLVSRGRWVGFGDVKLAIGLALFLADWRLAFIGVFAANLVGTLYVLPGMLRGRLKRGSMVPFGPLLIIGFLIATALRSSIEGWWSYLFF